MEKDFSFIASDLSAIKYCLYVLLALIAVSTLNNVIRTFILIRKETRKYKNDNFFEFSKKLVEENKLDEAIKVSKDLLSTSPNHAHANYALGRAFFMKDELEKSLEFFKNAIKIEPGWENNFVGPFIKEIEKRQKNTLTNEVTSN